MHKVLIVFGTRPEAIKMAPLIKKFQDKSREFFLKVCVTAQHREMLDQVLSIFNIKPDFDLNLMKSNQDLFDITSRVILGMRDVFASFNPDVVLVHGDTTTTASVALSSFYNNTRIGHVEAGLRTGNLRSPWPEEANRRITDVITDFYFAPTQQNKNNLLNENIPSDKILVTGNTVIDALYHITSYIESHPDEVHQLTSLFHNMGYNLNSNRRIILVTGHRRENFGEGFKNVCTALQDIASSFPDVDIIYPVHLNPNVRGVVFNMLQDYNNIFLLEPLDYLPFVYLMNKAYMIITDSGGIQEEAPALGKPVLVTRNTTERPEAVKAGTVKLVGTNRESIFHESSNILNDKNIYNKMTSTSNPYGDGKASEKIVNFLQASL